MQGNSELRWSRGGNTELTKPGPLEQAVSGQDSKQGSRWELFPKTTQVALHRAFPPLCLAMDATGSAELWHQCPALLYEALPGWRLQHCTPALPADLPASQGLHLTTGNTEQWRSFLPGQSLSADAEPCSKCVLGTGILSCSPSTHCRLQSSSEANPLHLGHLAGTPSGVPPL